MSSFKTYVDRTNHEVIIETPNGQRYRFDIDQVLSFADGLLRAAAICCGDDAAAKVVFSMKLSEMAEDMENDS